MLSIILFITYLTVLTTGVQHSHLPEERKACRNEKITYIPDNTLFYEEPVELIFDSGLNFNHIPITKILAEECGMRDREPPSSSRRGKRSPRGGAFRLNKYFFNFYRQSQKFLNPEFLEDIQHVVENLNHVSPSMEKVKFPKSAKYFQEVWENLENVVNKETDDHVDIILEQTFRTSLQLLIQKNHLSDILINHPIVLEKIKKRIPVENGKLLSEVKVSSVKCSPYHRDSQVVLYFKLRTPKVERRALELCDDIGEIKDDSYQYYEFPAATFKKNGHVYKVEVEKCALDGFTFCPFNSIRPTDCGKENLHHCVLKREPRQDFYRELQRGFAVYGDFNQVLTLQNGLYDFLSVRPRTLYYIVPQSDESVIIGEKELKQNTHFNTTIIRQVQQ